MKRQQKPKKSTSRNARTRIAAPNNTLMFGAVASIYVSEDFSTEEEECHLSIELSAAEANDEDRSITINFSSNLGKNTESKGLQTLTMPQLLVDRIPELLRKLEDQSGPLQAIEHIEGSRYRPAASARGR
jgi:hypothetical protein